MTSRTNQSKSSRAHARSHAIWARARERRGGKKKQVLRRHGGRREEETLPPDYSATARNRRWSTRTRPDWMEKHEIKVVPPYLPVVMARESKRGSLQLALCIFRWLVDYVIILLTCFLPLWSYTFAVHSVT